MRRSSFLLLAACSLGIGLAQAQSITFDGEVSDQTCSVTVNGQSDSTVILPTVKSSDLTGGAGTKTGLTPFTIDITGCGTLTAGTVVKFKFLGQNVVSGGYLGNTATSNSASGVAIQMTENVDGTNPIGFAGGVIKEITAFTASADSTEGSRNFAAQYISTDAIVTQGKVTAVVNYTLSYL